jgi:hypothetical protein
MVGAEVIDIPLFHSGIGSIQFVTPERSASRNSDFLHNVIYQKEYSSSMRKKMN